MRNLSIAAISLALTLTLSGSIVLACSCLKTRPLLDEYEDSESVIIAKFVAVERDPTDPNLKNGILGARMVVEKVYKGPLKPNEEIAFAQGGGADCIWTYSEQAIGGRFLLYLDPPKRRNRYSPDRAASEIDGAMRYIVSGCGRSRSVEGAAPDIRFLENRGKLIGKTRISGSFVSWTSKLPEPRNWRVKITGKSGSRYVRADKNGFFEIFDLPAGRYTVRPELPKGWKVDLRMQNYWVQRTGFESMLAQEDSIPVELEPKRHAEVNISITVDNAIRGKLVSPIGLPLPGVAVRTVRSTEPEKYFYGNSDTTDQSGEFEISEIPDGNYMIVANPSGKLSGTAPFRRVYHPRVRTPQSAGVFAIAPGKFINRVVFRIPEFVEIHTVSGRVFYLNDEPAADEEVGFVPDDEKLYEPAITRTDKNGYFELMIPAGTNGQIFANHRITESDRNCPPAAEVLNAYKYSIPPDSIGFAGNEDAAGLLRRLPIPLCRK